jgi:hypothetical protein
MISCQGSTLSSTSPVQIKESGGPEWIDYKDWRLTLQSVVRSDGVDYQLLRCGDARQALDRFIEQLAVPIPPLSKREARFAFWINAYNAVVLRHVLNFPEISSVATAVRNAPRYQFFKQKVFIIAGEKRSLDEIEHEILRPTFKDPRVHFAINCASKSCPPLLALPYEASTLEDQLDRAVKRFISDSRGVKSSSDRLTVSKLFQWFEEDFNQGIGDTVQQAAPDHQGIRRFLQRYLTGEMHRRVGIVRLVFADYDWSLNQSERTRP